MVEEELFEDDAPLAECPNDGPTLLSLDTAVKPVNVPAPTSENAIPEVYHLLDPVVSSPRLPKLPIPCESSLLTVDALLGPAGVGSDEDVWVYRRR